MNRRSPRIMLLLAVPAGIVGYLVGVRVIEALPLAPDLQDLLALTIPLFVAGLCMLPFLIPTFDRMAKRDLAAHRAQQAADAATEAETGPPTAAEREPDGGDRT